MPLNVWLRNPDGQITGKLDWQTLSCEKIRNTAGTITVTAAINDATVAAMAEGWGCVVDFPERRWNQAGDWYQWEGVRSGGESGSQAVVTFTALDDLSVIADETAWCDPTAPAVEGVLDYMKPTYDTNTGPAETVIKSYVRDNVGTTRHVNRDAGIDRSFYRLLTVAASSGRGPAVVGKAREDPLLEFLRAIANPNLMRMTCEFDLDTERVLFDCEPVVDHRGDTDVDNIVFSIENGTLADVQWRTTKPTVNRAKTMGGGQASGRRIMLEQDEASVRLWRRAVSEAIDRRDIGSDYQAAVDLVPVATRDRDEAAISARAAAIDRFHAGKNHAADVARVADVQANLDRANDYLTDHPTGAEHTHALADVTRWTSRKADAVSASADSLSAQNDAQDAQDAADVDAGKAQHALDLANAAVPFQLDLFEAAMRQAALDEITAAKDNGGVRSCTLIDSPKIQLGLDVDIGDLIMIEPYPGVTFGNHIESAKLDAAAGSGVKITMSCVDGGTARSQARVTRAMQTRIARQERRD